LPRRACGLTLAPATAGARAAPILSVRREVAHDVCLTAGPPPRRAGRGRWFPGASTEWPSVVPAGRAVVYRDRRIAAEQTVLTATLRPHSRLVSAVLTGGSDEPANLVSLCPMCHAAVHPHLGVSLARRLLQRTAVRLAEWLDTEGRLARQTRNFGPALKLFGLDAFRPAQIDVVEAALRGPS
jgi:hypothetical protein